MSKTKAAFGVIGFALVGATLWVALRSGPAPAEPDLGARYDAIAAKLVEDERDPHAWKVLQEYGHYMDGWTDAVAHGLETEATDGRWIRADYAFLPGTEARGVFDLVLPIENVADTDASEALVRAYAEQEPLDNLFRYLSLTDGLRAGSPLIEEFGLTVPIDGFMSDARMICHYEAGSMVLALRAGDERSATASVAMIELLAMLPLSQPAMLTLRFHLECYDALAQRLLLLIDEGELPPSFARGIILMLTRVHENEAERIRLTMQGAGIASEWMLTQAFRGYEDELTMFTDDPPARRTWASLAENARASEAWFDAVSARIAGDEGAIDPGRPPSEDGVALPEPFNTMAFSDGFMADLVGELRARRAETILRLALLVHNAEAGALPDNLAALVDAGIIRALPRPFDTDDTLYTRDPSAPLGYTLERRTAP